MRRITIVSVPKIGGNEIAIKTQRKSNSILGVLALFLLFGLVGHAAAVTLNPGDIVVANAGNVVVIDPQTGNVTIVACCVSGAFGIALDANGDIIVSDRFFASIIRIDPDTGSQTTISSGGLLLQPVGLAIAGNGDILVADMDTCCGPGTGNIVRVNPITGIQTLVSSGGDFVDPVGIDIEANGSLLAADFNARKLFRIDPGTGSQTTLAAFFPDGEPYDVVVAPDGAILIVDHNARAVIKIDPVTGAPTTITSGGLFDQPVGIALENTGNILVADITLSSIIRVDPATGSQTIVASGLTNPWGIAVVPASPTTLTLASNRDSFLRSGADDTNEGANERLRIQNSGDNRVVVAFDLTGVSTVGLQSATLVFTIAENSNNWGTTGRFVDAQRLFVDWTEGNGRNDVMVGGGPGFRGTGEGVTWHCGKDTNIFNQVANCSPLWNGGNYAPASAPSVLHTNGLLGQVAWDVTADFLAGANSGWVIRKQSEGQNGQVRYYSREGAALAGNASLAPRLVLVYSQ